MDNKNRIIDLCVGFFIIPVTYWALITGSPIIYNYIGGNSALEFIFNWAVIVLPLAFLLVYGWKRRAVALGMSYFVLAVFLLGFGTCLLSVAVP